MVQTKAFYLFFPRSYTTENLKLSENIVGSDVTIDR